MNKELLIQGAERLAGFGNGRARLQAIIDAYGLQDFAKEAFQAFNAAVTTRELGEVSLVIADGYRRTHVGQRHTHTG